MNKIFEQFKLSNQDLFSFLLEIFSSNIEKAYKYFMVIIDSYETNLNITDDFLILKEFNVSKVYYLAWAPAVKHF